MQPGQREPQTDDVHHEQNPLAGGDVPRGTLVRVFDKLTRMSDTLLEIEDWLDTCDSRQSSPNVLPLLATPEGSVGGIQGGLVRRSPRVSMENLERADSARVRTLNRERIPFGSRVCCGRRRRL